MRESWFQGWSRIKISVQAPFRFFPIRTFVFLVFVQNQNAVEWFYVHSFNFGVRSGPYLSFFFPLCRWNNCEEREQCREITARREGAARDIWEADPYIISLYYQKTEKPNDSQHSVRLTKSCYIPSSQSVMKRSQPLLPGLYWNSW